MSESLLPALTLVAAIALTYLFCIRPMRRGRCAMTPPSGPAPTAEQHRLQAEIEAARAQLAALRADPPAREPQPAAPHNGADRPS